MYGPECETDIWQWRYIHELYVVLFKGVDIVRYMKLTRVRWSGHMMSMTRDEIPSKLSTIQLDGKRTRGRPNDARWWIDDVGNYLGWRTEEPSLQIGTVGESFWKKSRPTIEMMMMIVFRTKVNHMFLRYHFFCKWNKTYVIHIVTQKNTQLASLRKNVEIQDMCEKL